MPSDGIVGSTKGASVVPESTGDSGMSTGPE